MRAVRYRPVFDQTGRRDIVESTANLMSGAEVSDQAPMIGQKFLQHRFARNVLFVTILDSLIPCNVSNRTQRGSIQLACAFSDLICDREELVSVFRAANGSRGSGSLRGTCLRKSVIPSKHWSGQPQGSELDRPFGCLRFAVRT